MKQQSTARLSGKSNALLLLVAVFLSIGCTLESGCTGCRVAPRPTPSERPAEALTKAGTLTSAPPDALLTCPTLGSSRAPATLRVIGRHKVVLSWRASGPADSNHAAAVGYCVYRSTKHKDTSPELVNSTPLPGTTCTDDLVENGKRYYYVVRAISAKGVTSIISNEASAPIPTGNKSDPSFFRPSAPLCREPASVK
jgi:hypothetical protein